MLTKDFIKEVEKLGLECSDCSTIFAIYYDDDLVSLASKDTKFLAGTAYDSFRYLSKELQEKLFNLLIEYASTPLDEREEPEKFYLQLTTLTATSIANYLNYNTTNGSFSLNCRCQTSKYQTQFTQAEIDEMKEKFGDALSGFKKIPVKDEEIE